MHPRGYTHIVHKFGARDGKRWGEKIGNIHTHCPGREGGPIPPLKAGTDRRVQTLQELEDAIELGDVHPDVQDDLREVMRHEEVRTRIRRRREREVLVALGQESERGVLDEDLKRLAHYLVEMGLVHWGSRFAEDEPGFDTEAIKRLRLRLGEMLYRWKEEDDEND